MSNQHLFNVKFTIRSAIEAIKWFKAQVKYILNPNESTLDNVINITRTLTASKSIYDAYKALRRGKKTTGNLAKRRIEESRDDTLDNADETDELKKSAKQDSKSKILSDKQKQLTDGYHNTDKFEVGKMYLFHYDPKHKKTLPYYDTFPLIIMMGFVNKGFYGINLHYLPVEARIILLSNLLNKAVFKGSELDRLNVSYNIVKNVTSFQLFRPCFKRYLYDHIQSVIKIIPSEDWGYAAVLPIENFKKKTKEQVWQASMNSVK
jgi:hypothetical protein